MTKLFGHRSVGLSRVYLAQYELEVSTDAVVHAALISLRAGADGDTIQGYLERFYRLNKIDGRAVAAKNMTIVSGHWNFGAEIWTAYEWADIGFAPINAIEVHGKRVGLLSARGPARTQRPSLRSGEAA